MSAIISFVASSQVKIFPDSKLCKDFTRASILSNESFSFTVAYKTDCAEYLPVSISVSAENIPVSVYKVGYVPVTHTKTLTPQLAAENKGAGLYPDVLLKRKAVPEVVKGKQVTAPYYEKDEKNQLNATGEYQSVLVTLNENGQKLAPGNYSVKIKITSLRDVEDHSEHTVNIKVIDAALCDTDIYYTNWFHYDCLCDIHGVKLYSEEYFSLLGNYFENAAKHGMNTLLIPAFTPPLDTLIDSERMNVQAVGIKVENGVYTFDFSLLERIIKLALDCGFKHFEHPHFFTQWGAEHAPNIYAGKKRIFGWDTNASGDEFKGFLNAYIPAFLSFAKKLGIDDRLFFHISDEPTDENEITYKKAHAVIKDLLSDYPSGDALSSIKFFENGTVKTPIVEITSADDFYGKCQNFWLYYTGGNIKNGSNRRITNKPYCTRILGLHLFRYKARGFLHWGYNYCYDSMSMGIFDPASDPCGYKQMPGVSFLSYPGINEVLPSLREKYMCEAMNDLRALKLLESFIGYEKVISLCEDFFGKKIDSDTMPQNENEMILFRETINDLIEKVVK